MTRRRFLASLLALCVAFLPLTASTAPLFSGQQMVASGTVTLTNMRLSAVNGTAFVDFSAAGVLTNYIGHKIRICDNSTPVHCIIGYVKGAGTAETLDAELVDAWTNSAADPYEIWIPGAGNLVTQAVNSAAFGIAYKAVASPAGKLYKCVNAITLTSGSLPFVDLIADTSANSPYTNFTPNGTSYRVGRDGEAFAAIWNSLTATNFGLTAYSLKQVLTPSATGVTITSLKGGTVYNFAAQETGFYYNSATFTYQLYKIWDAPVVASGASTNANTTLNLADGAASVTFALSDHSAYYTGTYMIAVYDASGRGILGYYKSAGAGAVVNANSGATQNWIYKDPAFAAGDAFTFKVTYVGN